MSVFMIAGGKLKVTADFTKEPVSRVEEWQEIDTPGDHIITLDLHAGTFSKVVAEIDTTDGKYRCDDIEAEKPEWYRKGGDDDIIPKATD